MTTRVSTARVRALVILLAGALLFPEFSPVRPATLDKPPLHGRHWMAVAGKPLAATAGARIFQQGGNAVDAACAMLAAVCTLFDDVGWGGETQALIYDPRQGKVVGINALGVAPSGATAEFFKGHFNGVIPENGALAALTPGNPGGIMVMLAEFGTMSLADVLAPAMELAEGYPIESELVLKIEHSKELLRSWPASRDTFLPHLGEDHEAPFPGEIFRQPDLLKTLQRLVAAETEARNAGKTRKEAIYAAYELFYRGELAREFVIGSQQLGGFHTLKDLAEWEVKIEDPVHTNYRGIEVYKLTTWTQGPVLLQTLNILENIDLRPLGYNSARYIHALCQAMHLAFADRDFYYGDPYFPPEEPIQGLLSKEYARERFKQINWDRNDPAAAPGDPYAFQEGDNPFKDLLKDWQRRKKRQSALLERNEPASKADFLIGTTSIQAADKNGWAVSITPSGGWMPSCLAGRTGVAMSQRMQSFVLDPAQGPYNVLEPGKRPRVTLTPGIATRNGKPFLCFSVQGGDTQEQNLLQLLLNIVEFGMTVQEACEAPNFNSFQMHSSFGEHESQPGRLTLRRDMPFWIRNELRRMGYQLDYDEKTSGPLTAILFDQSSGTLWGGASNHGEDMGIGW